MKAIVLKQFGGSENFILEDVEDPQLSEGTVKVKIKAAAFNPIDYQMRKGANESKLLKSAILGREMAGIIVGVHTSVNSFKVGDEVYGYVNSLGSNGTYAEYVVVPEEIIALKPENLTFNDASAIPLVGLTAIQTVERIGASKNDTFFITGGAGGVGSMVIRLLLQQGISNIYTTAGNDESRAKLITYGLPAGQIINYQDGNVLEGFQRLSGYKNATICIDTVGGRLSETCAWLIKTNGIYADITFLTTPASREILFNKGVTIINISNYAYALEKDRTQTAYYGNRLNLLKQYLDGKTLMPTPIKVVGGFDIDTVKKAHYLLENNLTKGNKLVMEVGK